MQGEEWVPYDLRSYSLGDFDVFFKVQQDRFPSARLSTAHGRETIKHGPPTASLCEQRVEKLEAAIGVSTSKIQALEARIESLELALLHLRQAK
jgi:hypothetical protein